jgi:hypothetical protein
MIDAVDHRLALGRKPGEDQADAGAQVGGHDRRALQRLDPRHPGGAALDVDPRAHAGQFGRMHEAILEDPLLQHALPVGQRQQRHHLRLKVGGKAREGFGDDMQRPHPAVAPFHRQPVRRVLDEDVGLLQLVGEGRDQRTAAADQLDPPAGDGGSQHVGAKLDAVGHHPVGGATQGVHPLDHDLRRPRPLDPRAHGVQAGGKVHDLGLARGIAQDRGALRQNRGHHQVLGRPDRDQRKRDHGPLQPARGLRVDIALAQVELGAQLLEPHQVQVHRARADGASPGQRDLGPAHARQQRSQNQHRGAHLAHDLVVRAHRAHPLGPQRQHPPALQRRHLAAEAFQQRRHGADVRQARRVGQRQRLVGQQRGRHQRQAGVLGARRPRERGPQ